MIEAPAPAIDVSPGRPAPPTHYFGRHRRAEWVGRFTLWSVTATLVGLAASVFTSALWLLGPPAEVSWFITLHRLALSLALAAGFVAFVMLFVVHNWLVPPRDFMYTSLHGARVHVGLTAYNDSQSIGHAVREFKACPEVHRVIVVDNSSTDGSARVAAEAGADDVVIETVRGYGACCRRALAEAAKGADIAVLCEGDMTFSAHDVKKFLAYLENCDLVVGTRATQELRQTKTQMDLLINPGNQVVAKLAQARFWGTRLTDLGCTYRAMRVGSFDHLGSHLVVSGNHFSAHMIIEALRLRMRVIEIPVVFRIRVGASKGVGSNKIKAARVALRMLGLIYRV